MREWRDLYTRKDFLGKCGEWNLIIYRPLTKPITALPALRPSISPISIGTELPEKIKRLSEIISIYDFLFRWYQRLRTKSISYDISGFD